MTRSPKRLRIAMLAFRGTPNSGGQGVYVRHMSAALTRLGHAVTVVAGPPYPELDDGVLLVPSASLELYRPEEPFKPARPMRDWVDVAERAIFQTGGYPEPLAFSLRAWRWLAGRTGAFDVVHDNQCLGYGLLAIQRRLPVVATIHHPITIDRDLDEADAPDPARRVLIRRWYRFAHMQARVARRLPHLITVSEQARLDTCAAFKLPIERVRVVHNGVDADLFRPRPDIAPRAGGLITFARPDVPLKGLEILLESVAKLRTEREVHLVVVAAQPRAGGPAARAVQRFGLADAVTFTGAVEQDRLVELFAQAQVAVVPSHYEGFSLPAAEAMACGVPLVATRAGALPEVTGTDQSAALSVETGEPGALADAIARLLDDRDLARRLGESGRRRVAERFSWDAAARRTVEIYGRSARSA